MAKLTTEKRNELPDKVFGLIQKSKDAQGVKEERKFPMDTRARAANAKARLTVAKGISPAEKEKIRNKANEILYGSTEAPKDRV